MQINCIPRSRVPESTLKHRCGGGKVNGPDLVVSWFAPDDRIRRFAQNNQLCDACGQCSKARAVLTALVKGLVRHYIQLPVTWQRTHLVKNKAGW